MKKPIALALLMLSAFFLSPSSAQCNRALMQYAERYPKAESQDLYKLVFQDLYGPGHLLTNADDARRYIGQEVEQMSDSAYPQYIHHDTPIPFPLCEYTLCDSNFVRVNLVLVKRGVIELEELVSAVMRSAEGLPTPDPRFVMTHSKAFKEAYDPHYRIIRRDIFEREFLGLIAIFMITNPVNAIESSH